MITTKFFTETDLNKLESKIAFYFRSRKNHSLLNVDLCSAFDPRDNEMRYSAAVMLEVMDQSEENV